VPESPACAAAVEEAEGHLGGFLGFSVLQALLTTLGEPVLNGARRMAQLFDFERFNAIELVAGGSWVALELS
jgi:hypothetical protein